MPLVSIIVPVYKVEPYLRRCVDSVLAQSFTDYELILVDDGSPDNCGMICDEYAKSDPRIRVIHQTNSGAAAARNTGIKTATGKYVAFCDSDDTVSTMWLERMFSYTDEGTLVIGAHCSSVEELGSSKKLEINIGTAYMRQDYCLFAKAGLAGFLWNTLYCLDIIRKNHLVFRERKDEGDYNEDLLFNLSYVRHVDKIVYTGFSDYLYNSYNDSLSRRNRKLLFEKYAEKYRLWETFIIQECDGSKELLMWLSTVSLFHFLTALREADHYSDIKKIALSDELSRCLQYADISKENPVEIKLLKCKNKFVVYSFYQLLKLKERKKP